MDVFDRRQARLRELIRTRYDGKQTRFAEAIDRSQNYVSRMLTTGENRKNIGEELAREIERILRLTDGWLDTDGTKPPGKVAEKVKLYGMEITQEGVALAREWEKLDDEWKAHVQTMVEMLVAKKLREDRKKPPRDDHDGPRGSA